MNKHTTVKFLWCSQGKAWRTHTHTDGRTDGTTAALQYPLHNMLRGDKKILYIGILVIIFVNLQMNILIDTGSSNFAMAASPNPDVDRYFYSHKYV